MDHKREEQRKAVALFRYGIISDILHAPRNERGAIQRLLEEKAARSYAIPGTRRTSVAAETIRGWVKDYRRGGFDALVPKPRSDVGQSRSIAKDIQDLLLMMKDEHPDYSIPVLILEVKKAAALGDDVDLPVSTVHRLLSHLTKPSLHQAIHRRTVRPGTPAIFRAPSMKIVGVTSTTGAQYTRRPRNRVEGGVVRISPIVNGCFAAT